MDQPVDPTTQNLGTILLILLFVGGIAMLVRKILQWRESKAALPDTKAMAGRFMQNMRQGDGYDFWKPVADAPAQPEQPAELVLGEWLRIVTHEPDKAPHILIAGESGTGKTTIAQAMLTQRGGTVAIADPKPTRPGARKWGGLAYVSIDEDGGYRSIELLFAGLLAEVNQRLVDMRTSTKPFEPLTIVADEWMTLLAKCPSAVKLYELATIGRELGMRLIILSTSDQVKSLRLEGRGDLRENFRFLRLGDKAMSAQPACRLQERPACLEWRGDNQPIDVETVDRLAAQVAGRVRVWHGVQGANSTLMQDLLEAARAGTGAAHQPHDVTPVRSGAPGANAVRSGAPVITHQEPRPNGGTSTVNTPATPAPYESPVISPDELRRLVEAVKMVGAGESMTAALCTAFETKKGSGNPKWLRARWLWGLTQAAEIPSDDQADELGERVARSA